MLKGPRLLLEIASIWDSECRLYMRIRQKSNRRIYCYFDNKLLLSIWNNIRRATSCITIRLNQLTKGQPQHYTGDHWFSTYAKFSEKPTFLTPWYVHVHTCVYQGVRNVSFSENVAYVLNEWPPEVQQKRISHFAIDGFKIWLWENKPLLRYGGVYVSFKNDQTISKMIQEMIVLDET